MLKLHYNLEKISMGLVGAIIVVASVGGIVEIAPLFTIEETVEIPDDLRPYTPLELAGREIYMREGCYACHSQMIRSLADEIDRYGPYSLAAESAYDHPMLWGSKRTGPDLARLGGKYSDDWHVAHLMDPREVIPVSIMPAYPWLTRSLDRRLLAPGLATLARLGVPYDDAMIENAEADALAQSQPDSDGAAAVQERYGEDVAVRAFDGDPARLTEMDAVVAYLQSLGTLTDAAHARLAEGTR
ncbi:MAG TPA: cytochrome-c oxidase, cbb3-type subunit II [Amaricoccus sp.]|uniref:cytochrome-c oxidase, cbb3-type subunit II n=1 Tax=Amaricoccus sp. TaxID=1872485 RepID=UPI002BCA161C|nr:cytochrome-c oxidase, cbb3-type subunit II [Amaricoccus sp.]HMQ93698.1 cytochrome-c oxidase, cbb3-type subunit II [Amaricoccus sp.]HMR52815.1 cytochrome-c oxidase, cbb3-type subunit II [Amaricoccus sp.]HMR60247.1 cytochrome-c oxidase, cbb3-type subunit II [Amaricoccus sp.]HMT99750.1 cytochrome-c oxidase, cbb3-type subunit II [Amaricoccus sp.]